MPTPPRLDPSDHEALIGAAAYGLNYRLDRLSHPRLLEDVARDVAAVALTHALATGQIVLRETMTAAVEDVEIASRRRLDRACAAENARDRLLVKCQEFAQGWASIDREQAERIAETLGVVLGVPSAG